MKKGFRFLAVACAMGLSCMTGAAIAAKPDPPLTVAVFGDWPYSTPLLNNAPLLLNSVNNDPEVNLVIHVGDIHSGSMPCTGAGLNPIPAGANPGWNQGVFNIFQQFKDPFVYTPGDNEWTDCHKTKESSSGYPLNELAAVRSLFFPIPGYTLGGVRKEVASQALENEGNPTDAQFVENVMWKQSNVLFVTLNVPGSNNDGLPWSGGTGQFLNEGARLQEVAERNASNLRWLDRAFKKAKNAAAVVIALQADMWDLAAVVPGGDGLNGYDEFVQALADHAVAFGRPVLLLNGDSHIYGADQPLADPTSATGLIHHTQAVPNLTRITVQGSTNTPNEWLRLAIDPSSPNAFTWQNVCYLSCP
ncbi:MAG: metallophosphoesterase [Nitrospirae bacterium]|nr:metallophosphoesterase [Candidatus Manganitrophaceae bacterium]